MSEPISERARLENERTKAHEEWVAAWAALREAQNRVDMASAGERFAQEAFNRAEQLDSQANEALWQHRKESLR